MSLMRSPPAGRWFDHIGKVAPDGGKVQMSPGEKIRDPQRPFRRYNSRHTGMRTSGATFNGRDPHARADQDDHREQGSPAAPGEEEGGGQAVAAAQAGRHVAGGLADRAAAAVRAAAEV